MVHSGYHPLKHRPLRIVFGWCTVDIILYDNGAHHPPRPLRIVFGWCTVDIILLSIVHLDGDGYHPLKHVWMDGAQWISSS